MNTFEGLEKSLDIRNSQRKIVPFGGKTVVSRSTSSTEVATFSRTYASFNVFVPITAPRCRLPSLVIETPEPSKIWFQPEGKRLL